MQLDSSRKIAKNLKRHRLSFRGLQTGIEESESSNPSVIISHTSYPGVEAHLFTLAHAAQWVAKFSDEHDVTLSFLPRDSESETKFRNLNLHAWERLISILNILMDNMAFYRNDIAHGEYATVIWGHHATEWHRELWESKVHEFVPPDQFIDYVDLSIRPHIRELNDLGFATVESCSGLMIDHPDREPYKAYVMFDERSYLGSTPHFFTLGDMAGWESMFAPHGFDAYIRVLEDDNIEDAWLRLLLKARILGPLLSQYRESHRTVPLKG